MDFKIDMDEDNMIFPFCVSFVFFFLYMILQLIDLNKYIKGLDILDASTTTRMTIITTYAVGYYVFFFKLLLQLFVLVVIVTMIVWIIVVLVNIIKKNQAAGGFASAADLRGGAAMELGAALESSAKGVISYIMGIFFSKHPNFLIIFFIVIPIFILLFTIGFSMFYDKDLIEEKNKDTSSKITLTNHNFMMFVIGTLVAFAVCYIFVRYMKNMLVKLWSEAEVPK